MLVVNLLQLVEDAGRAQVAARGGLGIPPMPSGDGLGMVQAGETGGRKQERQEHPPHGQAPMDVDESKQSVVGAAQAQVQPWNAQAAARASQVPTTATRGMQAAAAAAGLPCSAPGAYAGERSQHTCIG